MISPLLLTIDSFFSRHLTSLANSIEGVENEKEFLIRFAISVIIVFAVVLFRKKIAKGLLFIVAKVFGRKSDKNEKEIIESLTKPVSLLISVLSFNVAMQIIAPSGELNKLSGYLIKIGLIISICWGAFRYLNDELFFFSNITDDDSRSKQTVFKFIVNCSKILIVFVGALLILEMFGFSASRVFAALGIGGVAVAFACKDAVENLISGFIIVFTKPFSVNEIITIDNLTGIVEDIRVRSTSIRSVDGTLNILPNTQLTNAKIVNWSRMDKRLIDEKICITYKYSKADVDHLEGDIRELLKNQESVLQDDIRITFDEFSADGMDIEVFFYVNKTAPAEYSRIKGQINGLIKDLIDEHGVVLAYTSHSLYFDESALRVTLKSEDDKS